MKMDDGGYIMKSPTFISSLNQDIGSREAKSHRPGLEPCKDLE